MPFDGNGNATVTRNIAVTGQTVLAEQVNTPFADIQNMLSQVLLRSGVAPMTGPLNMNGFKINNLGDATSPEDPVTLQQLQKATPIGAVVDFAGTTPPETWVICAGQELSRTEYAGLFAVLGTTFGVGNGSTTFNVPDCRGRIIAGKDDMGGTDAGRLSGFWGALARTIAGVMGTSAHTLTVGQMPSHSHAIIDPGHTHVTDAFRTFSGIMGAGSGTASSTTGISIVANGSSQDHTNTQPTIIMNKIIKASF
jgi:microcystin-dependent protein